MEYQIGFRIKLDTPFILILSYVVLLPGLASFLLWIKGISMIGANRSGVFLHLMPILSAIMAMIFFNEKFITIKEYNYIKKYKKNICLTSPDLIDDSKLKILKYIKYLNKNKIKIDMICTKKHNIKLWKEFYKF